MTERCTQRPGDRRAAAERLNAPSQSGLSSIVKMHTLDPTGGRYWDRTSDFHRVKVALYR